MRTTAAPPIAARPTSFGRYLRWAAARRRRASHSSVRYTAVVFLMWYLPAPVFAAWEGLTSPAPATPLLTVAAGGALVLAGAAAVGWAAPLAGPVSASREWRAWVLSTPLDRNALLRRRAVAALAWSALPGVLIGALIAAGTGVRRGEALIVVLAAAVLAGTATAVAVLWQRRLTTAATARRWYALIGGLLVVAIPLDHLPAVSGDFDRWLLVAGTAAVAVIICWAAVAAVGLLPMTALTGGTGSTASLLAAVQDQSLAPLAPLLATPNSRRKGSATYRPLTGTGQKALLAVARRRVLRNRAALIRWAVMACLPYLALPLVAHLRWGPAAVGVVTIVAAVAAISGLCATARQVASNPPLAGRYGLSRFTSIRTAMAVPSVGALLWGVATAPALFLEHTAVLAVVVPLAALAVVRYRAGLPPFEATYQMGQQYSVDLIRGLTRGPAQYAGVVVLVAVLAARLG